MTTPSDASFCAERANQPGVTAAELTRWLRSAQRLERDVLVAEFTSERIGEGRGFMGHLERLTLRYDGDARGAPRSVVLKRASDVREIREAIVDFDAYDDEARFYNELAADSDILTPACAGKWRRSL